jgi:hypothetical protein
MSARAFRDRAKALEEGMPPRRFPPPWTVEDNGALHFRHGSMGREWGCRLLGRRGNLIFLQVCQG